MLFGLLVAVFCGTALARPGYPGYGQGRVEHHHGPVRYEPHHGQDMMNTPFGGSRSLTQGILCDTCTVSIEIFQERINVEKEQILAFITRLANLCSFCPSTEQCVNFFETEVPAVIDEFLALDPAQTCTELGFCNENTTLPGLLMTGLDENVAKDRVVKRMLRRARKMQQNMIRMLMTQNEDYMCGQCLNAVSVAREVLLDNNTQHEVMNFLYPICDYMPAEYQANCEEFVESVPFFMEMIATDILLDSTCEEFGFCKNATVEIDPVATLPDIFSRFGIPYITGGMGRDQSPFNIPDLDSLFPGQQRPQTNPGQSPFNIPDLGRYIPGQPDSSPFGQPGRNPYGQPGRNPYGQPGTGRNPYGQPGTGRNPYGQPGTGRNPYGQPGRNPYGQPGRNPYGAPQRPYKPSLNLENIFGRNPGGVFDSMPQIPGHINVPGRGRINFNFGNTNRRYQRSVEKSNKMLGYDYDKIMPKKDKKVVPLTKIIEYVPEPFPSAGIILMPEQNYPDPENCEICKAAVIALKAWLQDNSAEIQRMVLQVAQPVCAVFPSPMKEDCVTDVTEFSQTFLQELISSLDQNQICKWIGSCQAVSDLPPEAPVLPTENAAPEVPTTWPFFP